MSDRSCRPHVFVLAVCAGAACLGAGCAPYTAPRDRVPPPRLPDVVIVLPCPEPPPPPPGQVGGDHERDRPLERTPRDDTRTKTEVAANTTPTRDKPPVERGGVRADRGGGRGGRDTPRKR